MDTYLVNYLKSGNAWVLVGSGPSIQQGYPTWGQLANEAMRQARTQMEPKAIEKSETTIAKSDFPSLFQQIRDAVGGGRLLEILRNYMSACGAAPTAPIYEHLARWPIPVYLTTNYDDSLAQHLAAFGEAYNVQGNTADSFSLLVPDHQGAIVKLHGDLRSEQGLILTSNQFAEVLGGEAFDYWRTKMTSICQMVPLVIIGHSLTDPNVCHVLEAAKAGAGVVQPVCWIAPDATHAQVREFLDIYRIRVIPYSNKDGRHENLTALLRYVSEFIPPRVSVRFTATIDLISNASSGPAAAPGLFVFNALARREGADWRRAEVLYAAIEGTASSLDGLGPFTVQQALEQAGWPGDVQLDAATMEAIVDLMESSPVFERQGGDVFSVAGTAAGATADRLREFQHVQERFRRSLVLRARREFSGLAQEDAERLARDVDDAALTYFEHCGLTMASALFAGQRPSTTVPSSILGFIVEASTKYDDLLLRQCFCSLSLSAIVHANDAEREYLGRLAQGFFAFHALGVFGAVAEERLRHSASTAWLIDSNIQIMAMATHSEASAALCETLTALNRNSIRMFTLEQLFDELYGHFLFAQRRIEQYGPDSAEVLAAALGDVPYKRSNAFLEGFVNWRAAGNGVDWKEYLYVALGSREPHKDDIRNALKDAGIETINYSDWPGFDIEREYGTSREYEARIVDGLKRYRARLDDDDPESWGDPYRKARPEAQAMAIVAGERAGFLHMLSSDVSVYRDAWFVSDTSALNLIAERGAVTMQPSAFLHLASTLGRSCKSGSDAFCSILLSVARSGVSLLSQEVAGTVFSGIIEEAKLALESQREAYRETVQKKYGESLDRVIARIRPVDLPVAGIQLAHQVAAHEAEARARAEAAKHESEKKARGLEKDLKDVEKFRGKMLAKQEKAKRNKRKQQSKSKRKKRKR